MSSLRAIIQPQFARQILVTADQRAGLELQKADGVRDAPFLPERGQRRIEGDIAGAVAQAGIDDAKRPAPSVELFQAQLAADLGDVPPVRLEGKLAILLGGELP